MASSASTDQICCNALKVQIAPSSMQVAVSAHFFGLPEDTEKCSTSHLLNLELDFITGVKILTNWNDPVDVWIFWVNMN